MKPSVLVVESKAESSSVTSSTGMIALTFTSGMNASLDVTSVLTRVVKALSFWKNVKLERLNVCMLIGDGGPAVPVVVHGVRASALMV